MIASCQILHTLAHTTDHLAGHMQHVQCAAQQSAGPGASPSYCGRATMKTCRLRRASAASPGCCLMSKPRITHWTLGYFSIRTTTNTRTVIGYSAALLALLGTRLFLEVQKDIKMSPLEEAGKKRPREKSVRFVLHQNAYFSGVLGDLLGNKNACSLNARGSHGRPKQVMLHDTWPTTISSQGAKGKKRPFIAILLG